VSRLFLVSVNARSNVFDQVTQIPLETSPPGEEKSSSRPPWIRPIRKKTPSVAARGAGSDGGSHRSSPEAFSPSEFFVDPTLATSPQLALPNAFPPAPIGGASSSCHPQRPSFSVPSSMDASNDTDMETAGMHIPSPSEMMNMFGFGDGEVDIATLFSGTSDFNIGQHLTDSNEPLYGHT